MKPFTAFIYFFYIVLIVEPIFFSIEILIRVNLKVFMQNFQNAILTIK